MRRASLLLAALLVVMTSPVAALDEEPPALVSIHLSSTDAVPGNVVEVRMRFTDDSGVNRGFVEFWGPEQAFSWHGTDCDQPLGGLDAEVVCRLLVRDTAPAGTYRIRAIQVDDVEGNIIHYHPGQEFQEGPDHQVAFAVASENHDLDPPVLHSVAFTDAEAGGEVVLEARVSDATGVARVGFGFGHESGSPQNSGSCELHGVTDEVVRCAVAVPPEFPAGTYYPYDVQLVDLNGVRMDASYPWAWEGTDWDPSFLVESEHGDTTPPALLRFEAPRTPVERGESFQVRLWADDETGVASAFSVFHSWHQARFKTYSVDLQPRDCTPWAGPEEPMVCTGTVPDDFPLGSADLLPLFLEDPATNQAQYRATGHPEYAGMTVVPTDDRNNTRIWVGPRPVEVDLPAVRVEPVLVETLPERVVPVAFNLTGMDVVSVNVTFSSGSGSVSLGASGCVPDYRVDRTGFQCHVIVPADAEGEFSLSEVVIHHGEGDPTVVRPVDGPSFLVDAATEDEGLPVPVDWEELVVEGITTASYNSDPDRPAEYSPALIAPNDTQNPGPRTTEDPILLPSETDGAGGVGTTGGEPVEPVPHAGDPSLDIPGAGPGALLGLAGVAAFVAGRRR